MPKRGTYHEYDARTKNQQEAVVFMHKECPVCRSEGFVAHTRVLLRAGDRHVIATLYQITTDLIAPDEAALSNNAPGDSLPLSRRAD